MRKEQLFTEETIIQKIKFKNDNKTIFMKRDDLLSFGFGGNKVRLYEYIMGDVLSKGVKKIVTYGSPYSNFLRVTAAACSYFGVACDLIILKNDIEDTANLGNRVLLDYFDAQIVYCKESEAHDFIDEYKEECGVEGVDYIWIPGGGHTDVAAFGYVDAAYEIQRQLKDQKIDVDAIFLPCGTGTTQAGLIYGFRDMNIPIYGVTVARTKEKCQKEIMNLLTVMDPKWGTASMF